MDNKKDELISGSELARRLNVSRVYISNKKEMLKNAKCTYAKKFYYIKSAKLLGKNPNTSNQSQSQKKETPKSNENWNVITDKDEIKKTIKQFADKKEIKKKPLSLAIGMKDEDKDLLTEIENTLKDKDTVYDKALLDGLKAKAAITKTYYEAENEKIKNRKLEDNLFERDEVIRILSFAMNMIRNSIINLPNNYAVSLEGLSQKEIKDFVTDDTNKILEDLQNIGNQFDD